MKHVNDFFGFLIRKIQDKDYILLYFLDFNFQIKIASYSLRTLLILFGFVWLYGTWDDSSSFGDEYTISQYNIIRTDISWLKCWLKKDKRCLFFCCCCKVFLAVQCGQLHHCFKCVWTYSGLTNLCVGFLRQQQVLNWITCTFLSHKGEPSLIKTMWLMTLTLHARGG